MANKNKNEIDLLAMSVEGNCAAFELVVTKYQSLVCAITYNATGNVEKSEELAQETFVKAWKNLTSLNDLAKFKAWLCSIARSTVQAYFRSSKRDPLKNSAPIDSASNISSDQPGPIDAVISKEQQNLVDSALQQLPDQYRQPLILFYRSEQSTKAVAAALDLSEDTVRQRLHRGRKLLKDELTSVVETTLARTAPKKAFTAAVMASVAAITAKTVATAAAVIAIAAGAAITYKNIKDDSSTQDANPPIVASMNPQSAQPAEQSVIEDQSTNEAVKTNTTQAIANIS
ncbi:MAG: sigma-70 family RNA polymerase sigma factor, partial [Anaerohalosphaera sp.]|nr:sigma-70 family RNA polymerase sigma factor [Anaerohalosphaera sp.]